MWATRSLSICRPWSPINLAKSDLITLWWMTFNSFNTEWISLRLPQGSISPHKGHRKYIHLIRVVTLTASLSIIFYYLGGRGEINLRRNIWIYLGAKVIEGYINLLLHTVQYMTRLDKKLFQFQNGSSKKNSYERRNYESVNEKSLS